MLERLPDELVCDVVSFLDEKSFFQIKVVLRLSNTIYYHDKIVTIEHAIKTTNVSLVRDVISYVYAPDDLLDSVNIALNDAKLDLDMQKMLIDLYLNVFHNRYIVEIIKDKGYIWGFTYVLSKYNNVVTLLDVYHLYLIKKYKMLALVFIHLPALFVMWIFGDYTRIISCDEVECLALIYMYLPTKYKPLLSNIITKYHDWLWNKRLDTYEGIRAIISINNINVIKFNPYLYIAYALHSTYEWPIIFLIAKGLRPTWAMLSQTQNNDISRILLSKISHEYTPCLIMILIVALIFTALSIKIEYSIVGKNVAKQSKGILCL